MKFWFILVLSLCVREVWAQTVELEQIKLKWRNETKPERQVDLLNEIFLNSIFRNVDTAWVYGKMSYEKSQKIDYQIGMATYWNHLGILYRSESNYPQGIESLLKSLEINQKIKDSLGIANNYINIGLIYDQMNNYEMAVGYFEKCLEIKKQRGDWAGVANVFFDLGKSYLRQKNYQKAIMNFRKTLQTRLANPKTDFKTGDNYAAINSRVYSEMGIAMYFINQKDSAKFFLEKANQIQEPIDHLFWSRTSNFLGILAYEQQNWELALAYYKKAMINAKKHKNLVELRESYYYLCLCLLKTKRNTEAEQYLKEFSQVQDSIFRLESVEKIAKLQRGFDLRESEAKIEIQKKDIENQVVVRNSIIFFAFLLIVLIVFVYRNFRLKTQANQLLEEKNAEVNQTNEEINLINNNLNKTIELVDQQKQEIEKQNDNITSSIRYAHIIQKAILPMSQTFAKVFGEENFFILYKPRDIVSGDFYWLHQYAPNQAIVVVADCTGHGVPGAFMSMISDSLLNSIVIERGMVSPKLILTALDKGIQNALKQEQTKNRDGMDAVIIKIDDQKKTLFFSGAMNDLHFISENDPSHVQTLKGTRKSIGGNVSFDSSFAEHSLQIDSPSTFYLCTDGYQDQFGSQQNRKFMIAQLKHLFQEIYPEKMEHQRVLLDDRIEEWMHEGSESQIDDITIIGLRLGVCDEK